MRSSNLRERHFLAEIVILEFGGLFSALERGKSTLGKQGESAGFPFRIIEARIIDETPLLE